MVIPLAAGPLSRLLALLTLVAILASCSQLLESVPNDSETLFEAALKQADTSSGIAFSQLVDEEREGEAHLRVYADSADKTPDTSYLTVIVSNGEAAWVITQAESPETKLEPQRCKYCTKQKWVAGYWKTRWQWRLVNRVATSVSAAWCASKGGAWAAGVCSYVVSELFPTKIWIPGYWECIRWEWSDVCYTPIRAAADDPRFRSGR